MAKEINITIENRLIMEKRDMNIYHHSTGSVHMISYNSSVIIPLMPVIEDDYLHISIVTGPGDLKYKSIVNLPSWLDFEFSPGGGMAVNRSGKRTLLKILPGPPTWQLKMTLQPLPLIKQSSDRVTVGDENQEYRHREEVRDGK